MEDTKDYTQPQIVYANGGTKWFCGLMLFMLYLVVGGCILFYIFADLPNRAKPGFSDEVRREHYLMPDPNSTTWAKWVVTFGDNADSWELFTHSFNTRYIRQLAQRVIALEKLSKEANDARRIVPKNPVDSNGVDDKGADPNGIANPAN